MRSWTGCINALQSVVSMVQLSSLSPLPCRGALPYARKREWIPIPRGDIKGLLSSVGHLLPLKKAGRGDNATLPTKTGLEELLLMNGLGTRVMQQRRFARAFEPPGGPSASWNLCGLLHRRVSPRYCWLAQCCSVNRSLAWPLRDTSL